MVAYGGLMWQGVLWVATARGGWGPEGGGVMKLLGEVRCDRAGGAVRRVESPTGGAVQLDFGRGAPARGDGSPRARGPSERDHSRREERNGPDAERGAKVAAPRHAARVRREASGDRLNGTGPRCDQRGYVDGGEWA